MVNHHINIGLSQNMNSSKYSVDRLNRLPHRFQPRNWILRTAFNTYLLSHIIWLIYKSHFIQYWPRIWGPDWIIEGGLYGIWARNRLYYRFHCGFIGEKRNFSVSVLSWKRKWTINQLIKPIYSFTEWLNVIFELILEAFIVKYPFILAIFYNLIQKFQNSISK